MAGGESNYVDKAFNATATLTAEGSSSLDFEIPINEAITDVVYNFSDAASAVASGLPEGLEATVSQSSITISGTPTEYGDFVVGISTTGNSIAATASGVITVLPPAASISVDGEDNSSQTVIIGERIENIIVTWLYADDAAVEGLPEGILTSFSATEEKLTIYGTPTEVGVFEYTVSTVGNASPASLSGTIEVTTPLNAQVASAFKIYPNPIENGLLSIEVGKSNSIHSVRIINMSGQMVFDKSYDRVKALSLDLQLSTGLYHILMNTTSGTIKEKLIVK